MMTYWVVASLCCMENTHNTTKGCYDCNLIRSYLGGGWPQAKEACKRIARIYSFSRRLKFWHFLKLHNVDILLDTPSGMASPTFTILTLSYLAFHDILTQTMDVHIIKIICRINRVYIEPKCLKLFCWQLLCKRFGIVHSKTAHNNVFVWGQK